MDIELESRLIEQEHRFIQVIRNYFSFYRRRQELDHNDPRPDAALHALIWRLLSPATTAGASFGVASILASYFAYQANILLEVQNIRISEQSQLGEAARRSALNFELASIFEDLRKIDNEHNAEHGTQRDQEFRMPKLLEARIISLSNILKPYRQLDITASFSNAWKTTSHLEEYPGVLKELIFF